MKEQRSETADFVLRLQQASNLALRRLAPHYAKSRITPQQGFILSILASSEDSPTLADIARGLMVSKQNVTGMIARLESAGMVKRTGDSSDLRASRITLTKRGAQVWQKLAPQYDQWVNALLADLSEGDRKALLRAVPKLIDAMGSD